MPGYYVPVDAGEVVAAGGALEWDDSITAVAPAFVWSCRPDDVPQSLRGGAPVTSTVGTPVRYDDPEAGAGWHYPDVAQAIYHGTDTVPFDVGNGVAFTLAVYSRRMAADGSAPLIFDGNGGPGSRLFGIYHKLGNGPDWGTFYGDWQTAGEAMPAGENTLAAFGRDLDLTSFYRNGAATGGSFATASGANAYTNGPARFGSGQFSNNYANGVVYWVAVWVGYNLTAQDHANLYARRNDPYLGATAAPAEPTWLYVPPAPEGPPNLPADGTLTTPGELPGTGTINLPLVADGNLLGSAALTGTVQSQAPGAISADGSLKNELSFDGTGTINVFLQADGTLIQQPKFGGMATPAGAGETVASGILLGESAFAGTATLTLPPNVDADAALKNNATFTSIATLSLPGTNDATGVLFNRAAMTGVATIQEHHNADGILTNAVTFLGFSELPVALRDFFPGASMAADEIILKRLGEVVNVSVTPGDYFAIFESEWFDPGVGPLGTEVKQSSVSMKDSHAKLARNAQVVRRSDGSTWYVKELREEEFGWTRYILERSSA